MATGHRGSRQGRLAEVGGPWQESPGTQQTLPTPGFSRKQLESSRRTILLCASFPILPGNAHSRRTQRASGCLHREAQRRKTGRWCGLLSQVHTPSSSLLRNVRGRLLVYRAAMETLWLVTFRGSRVILLLSLLKSLPHTRSGECCKHHVEGKNSKTPRKLYGRLLYQKGNSYYSEFPSSISPGENLQTVRMGVGGEPHLKAGCRAAQMCFSV